MRAYANAAPNGMRRHRQGMQLGVQPTAELVRRHAPRVQQSALHILRTPPRGAQSKSPPIPKARDPTHAPPHGQRSCRHDPRPRARGPGAPPPPQGGGGTGGGARSRDGAALESWGGLGTAGGRGHGADDRGHEGMDAGHKCTTTRKGP